MGKDGEQDAIHAGSVLEGAHRSCSSPDFSEASLDGIGGTHAAAVSFGFIAEAGEQLVEVVAQTGDSGRIWVLKALCKATCSRASCRGVGGIHDLVQGPFDLRLIGFANLVENVSDLVGPAALHRDAVKDAWQGREQAGAAIDADHVEPLAGEPAAVELAEEFLPF